MIPDITISNGEPVIYIPLFVIVLVTALKDLVEDAKRKRSDQEENNRTLHRVVNGRLEKTLWRHARIGDIIKVSKISKNNELSCIKMNMFPAIF